MTMEAIKLGKFAARLKSALADSGKSARAVAIEAGVSTSVFSQYASGKTMPSLDRGVAIAHALGVNPEWLALGSGVRERGGFFRAFAEDEDAPPGWLDEIEFPHAVWAIRLLDAWGDDLHKEAAIGSELFRQDRTLKASAYLDGAGRLREMIRAARAFARLEEAGGGSGS